MNSGLALSSVIKQELKSLVLSTKEQAKLQKILKSNGGEFEPEDFELAIFDVRIMVLDEDIEGLLGLLKDCPMAGSSIERLKYFIDNLECTRNEFFDGMNYKGYRRIEGYKQKPILIKTTNTENAVALYITYCIAHNKMLLTKVDGQASDTTLTLQKAQELFVKKKINLLYLYRAVKPPVPPINMDEVERLFQFSINGGAVPPQVYFDLKNKGKRKVWIRKIKRFVDYTEPELYNIKDRARFLHELYEKKYGSGGAVKTGSESHETIEPIEVKPPTPMVSKTEVEPEPDPTPYADIGDEDGGALGDEVEFHHNQPSKDYVNRPHLKGRK